MAGGAQRLLLTHSTCLFETTLSNHLTLSPLRTELHPCVHLGRMHLSDWGSVQDHLVDTTPGPAGQREVAQGVRPAHALKGPQRCPRVPVLTWEATGEVHDVIKDIHLNHQQEGHTVANASSIFHHQKCPR